MPIEHWNPRTGGLDQLPSTLIVGGTPLVYNMRGMCVNHVPTAEVPAGS
jgi:hypothetical protein